MEDSKPDKPPRNATKIEISKNNKLIERNRSIFACKDDEKNVLPARARTFAAPY